jgi:hypothetical protein
MPILLLWAPVGRPKCKREEYHSGKEFYGK